MDLQKYWDSKHKYYADADWEDEPTIFSRFTVQHFPKSGKLLELGAGQGQDSRFFAGLGYQVVSTDFNDFALEVSREKAKKKKLDKTKFLNIDMSQGIIPFDNNSFDIVYSHLSIHYFDDNTTKALFQEINRVLKKDGIIAFLANSMSDPDTKEFEKIAEFLYRDREGLQKRYFSVEHIKKEVDGLFEIVVLDGLGAMLDPDKPDDLIRFIGRKV